MSVAESSSDVKNHSHQYYGVENGSLANVNGPCEYTCITLYNITLMTEYTTNTAMPYTCC